MCSVVVICGRWKRRQACESKERLTSSVHVWTLRVTHVDRGGWEDYGTCRDEVPHAHVLYIITFLSEHTLPEMLTSCALGNSDWRRATTARHP